ncbi:carbohydrate ABC transporter permease [Phormidium sp. CCY1219]|uniref:carbohydrate ABC transporter permease n=1 Tax=Phormidium sp. CCY1219 TaxID=2886104 RepID=UPI002D1EBEEF|nr:carbohydrate ABC transporter permease [Phormidium sp. CCY1219]MEB3826533.1 carbohydrate ABC transporter permease [Phormidium sp. CCY1219]
MSQATQTSDKSAPQVGISWGKIILYGAIFLIVAYCLGPVLWQLLTSFKVNEDIETIPNVYFPTRYTLGHYQQLFIRRPFLWYLFNSAFVSISSTVLCLGIGAPAAYALTRLKLPGERIILIGVLVVTLFPYILLFLGLLETIKTLGLGNNYLALIVPYTAKNLPLTILVLRSFFKQLPTDLEDMAKVDGYKTWQILLKIVLPLTVPALVTTGILAFIFAWNEFLFALTFITEETMKTIPVAVSQISGATQFETPYGPLAAATILGTLPLIVLVLFFQRKIVQGLTAGAVKG